MTTKIDAFIAEIRDCPEFIAAVALDSQYSDHIDNIERGLNAVDRWVDNDPAIIEIFDNILVVIARIDLSWKERLLEVGRLFTQVRDVGRITH
jgi:hypothetical protein